MGGLAWREGPLLVAPAGAALPLRCVRCGVPSAGSHPPRRLYWHHPGVYVLLINLLVYAVVALLTRRSVEVRIPVCPLHRSRGRRGRLLAVIGVVAGAALAIGGLVLDQGALCLLGAYVALAAVVHGIVATRLFGVERVDERGAVLSGVHPALLDELPERPA